MCLCADEAQFIDATATASATPPAANAAHALSTVFQLCEYGPIMQLKMGAKVHPYSEELALRLFRDVILGLEFRG